MRVTLSFVWLLVWLASAGAAETPLLLTKLSESRAFLGDPVRYTIEMRGFESSDEPSLPGFEAFEVRYLGASTNSHVVTRFVQGRRVVDSSRGVVHSYELIPRQAGALVVPAPIAMAGGVEIRGNALDLFVVPPEENDHVRLHAVVKRTGTYPLQPFVVELRIFVRRLPRPYQADDPLAYLDVAPRLTIPWVEAPDGVEAVESVSDWLSPMLSQPRGFEKPVGFAVNDVTLRGGNLFSLLDRPQTAVFDFKGRDPDAVTMAGVRGLEGRENDYKVYTLQRRFIPLRAGRIEFAPSSVRGSFIIDVKDRRGVTEDVFTRGGGLTVDVDDAPEAGRPAAFENAFGTNFTIRADVLPRRARVGDPLELTVEIEGRGNVAELAAPDLAASPAFAEAFRFEAPSVERRGRSLVARYPIRAVSADVERVPPIPFAWFDLDTEAYGEAASEPVPITIEEIAALGASDIVRFGDQADVRDPMRAEGLFGNVTDPRQVDDEAVNPIFVAAAPVGLLLAYGLLAVIVGRRRSLAGDPLRRRRRTAVDRATRRLAEARALGRADGGDGAARGFAAALRGLVADAAGVSEAGLLARDAAGHLRALGVDDATADRVARALDQADGQRYGGASVTVGDEAETLVGELVGMLRRSGALS